MARLETDDIALEISNIITFTTEGGLPVAESFTFKFDFNGKKLFNNVTRTKFELFHGNIDALLNLMSDILDGQIQKGARQFDEPEFEFELECIRPAIPFCDQLMYQFTVWVLSGQWQPMHSSSGVGCKFLLYHNELASFFNDLYEEYQVRRIVVYNE